MHTTHPTKPGIYLFSGHRGMPHGLSDVSHSRRPEIVRVIERTDGSLLYVGDDVFYHPEQAVGVWVEITALSETMVQQGRELALRALVPVLIPKLFESAWAPTEQADSYIIHRLCDYGSQIQNQQAATELLQHAIQMGALLPGKERGTWRLP